MNEKPQIFESYKINHVCNKLLFLLPRVAWCENCTVFVTRLLTAWEVIAILLSMNESYDCPTDSTQHGDHDNDHITRYHHFITPQ